MWSHTEEHLHSLLAALDETLNDINLLQQSGKIQTEGAVAQSHAGFTRLV
jgi:hypothetical protein